MTARLTTPRSVVNVREFGATGDGVTDDSVAIQNAVDSVASTGGVVYFPPGKVYLLDSSSISIAPNNPKPLAISGYGATIKLSATVATFVSLGKVADYDLHSNITVEGFDVDGGDIPVTGYGAVIFGNWEGTVVSDYLNFDNITVRDIYAYDIPVSANLSTSRRPGIFIGMCQSEPSEATQNTCTNITVQNIHQEGGEYGVHILGTTGHALDDDFNMWLDNILVENCYHSRGNAPVTAFLGTTNFHLGSVAYGGRATIRNCVGKYAGDCGLEINAFENGLVENCTQVDAYTTNFYHTNYNARLDEGGQTITFRNCRAERRSLTAGVLACGFSTDDAGGALGTVVFDGCSFFSDSTSHFTYGALVVGPTAGTRSNIKRVVVRDLTSSEVVVYNSASNASKRPIVFACSGTVVQLSGVTLKTVAAVSGGGTLAHYGITLDGVNAKFAIDGTVINSEFTGAGAGPMQGIAVGRGVAGTSLSGSISNLRIASFGDASNPIGVSVVSSPTLLLGRLDISGCDFSGMTAGSDIYVGDAVNGAKTKTNRCIYHTPPAPATITLPTAKTIDETTAATAAVVRTTAVHGLVTGDAIFVSASNSTPSIYGWRVVTVVDATHFSVPVTTTIAGSSGAAIAAYRNADGYEEDVVVSGGTVTVISVSTNAGKNFTATGLTAGVFRLRSGDLLHVTNSSLPTVTKIPRP